MPNSPSTINHAPSGNDLGVPLLTELISNEVKFLIACCQTNPNKQDIEFILSLLNSQRLTPNTLINLATQHGILPLVYKTIKNLPPVTRSSHENFLTDLKSAYRQISKRNMLMSAELIRIMKLLKDNDIDALAFKGPALSQIAYGNITLRQFGDLDILIKRSNISPMIDLLIAEGYVPEIELNAKIKETFLNALNVIGFYKSTSNILIEVHWELLSKNYAIKWDENALWNQRLESITINNKSIQVLPYEEHILYLCTHGSKHLFERLEWVCDIDRSIKVNSGIHWQYLLNEAEKRGIKRMLYLGLALSQHFFRLELPELLQENIKQDKKLSEIISKVIKINFSESPKKGKSYSSFKLLWNMRENFSDQLRFSWYGLFSPKFDDFKSIRLPRYLTFLYPILRPFRLAIKYIQH